MEYEQHVKLRGSIADYKRILIDFKIMEDALKEIQNFNASTDSNEYLVYLATKTLDHVKNRVYKKIDLSIKTPEDLINFFENTEYRLTEMLH